MPLAAGTRLGPYEILSLLGKGGMGEVYKANDTRLDRTVAIKVLPDRSTNVGHRVRALAPGQFAVREREFTSAAALYHREAHAMTVRSPES